MKILCIGDSMGLPREGVCYSDTWIKKMKDAFPQHDFISCFTRGMLMKDAFNNLNFDYKNYDVDGYILQTGICDCSPRYINDKKFFWKAIISIVKKLKLEPFFWRLIKFFFKRDPKCVYTASEDFRKIFDYFITNLAVCGKFVIIIKIGKVSPSVLTRNPYINIKVDEYNCIIDDITQNMGNNVITINPLEDVSEELFVDGYHCNSKGMEVVFNHLKEAYSSILLK